jgi:hypothetical protein
MLDGKIRHGEIADRLRGILATYKTCREYQIKFYIYHDSPFMLENYLLPNDYDWRINKNEISYNSHDTFAFILFPFTSKGEECFQENFMKKKLLLDYKQIHVYTNAYYTLNENYSLLFKELFKPSFELKKEIEYHHAKIGNRYIALAFRFQQLMGDFEETGSTPILSINQRKILMKECINEIYKIKKQNPQYSKLFITSDSITFLNEIQKIEFIYIVPGDIIHTDSSEITNHETYMKIFTDFLMLSKADKILLMCTGKMYKSGFSRSAALVNNIPFEINYF